MTPSVGILDQRRQGCGRKRGPRTPWASIFRSVRRLTRGPYRTQSNPRSRRLLEVRNTSSTGSFKGSRGGQISDNNRGLIQAILLREGFDRQPGASRDTIRLARDQED